MLETFKKIRILHVAFDTEIKNYEVPAFRGAVIDKVGKDSLLFHNHFDENRFRYRYPLIQYKQIGRKPVIFCVDSGVDEIHKFFEQHDWSLHIGQRYVEMKIASLRLNQFTIQVWDKMFDYSILNWIALNQENIRKYEETGSLSEKITFLESILTANILSFAKGIDWSLDKTISLKITAMHDSRQVKLKGQPMLGFNLGFTTNVFLPNFLGLGKGVSLGFGMVKAERTDNNGRNAERKNQNRE